MEPATSSATASAVVAEPTRRRQYRQSKSALPTLMITPETVAIWLLLYIIKLELSRRVKACVSMDFSFVCLSNV